MQNKKNTKKKKYNGINKKKLSIRDLGDNYIHRFALTNNLPFLEIIYFKFNGYNALKNVLVVNYNKLIKKESNLDQYFIDVELGIKLKIDTIKQLYELEINEKVLIKDKFYFEGDVQQLINYIEACRGVFLHIACNDSNNGVNEEFIINIFNVIINNNNIYEISELNRLDTFLTLPDSQWYQEGSNIPAGLAVACTIDAEPDDPQGIVIIEYPNNDIYCHFEEFFRQNLIIEDGFAINLNLIIDEIKEHLILAKVELMDVDDKNILYETISPIVTSQIYLNFKYYLKENGYAFLFLKEGFSFNKLQVEINEDGYFCKLRNIIILDDDRKKELKKWIDPMRLDLGGLDAKKKIIINTSNLEVGIYKYFLLRELNAKNLRKIVNEMIGYKIAKEIGLPVTQTLFHMESNSIGILSALINPPVYKFYNVDIDKIGDFDSLVYMVVFDVFICNADRHSDNICLTKKDDGNFYPILIDHTRCLGGLEDSGIDRLKESTFPVLLNLTGLGAISDRITSLDVFANTISKIKSLNINNIIRDVFVDELNTHIKACNVYKDNYIEYIALLLAERQKNIDTILRKSLGF